MFSEQLLERLPQWLSQITPDFTSLDPSAITDFFMIQIEGVQSYDELRLKAITSLVDFLDERKYLPCFGRLLHLVNIF